MYKNVQTPKEDSRRHCADCPGSRCVEALLGGLSREILREHKQALKTGHL